MTNHSSPDSARYCSADWAELERQLTNWFNSLPGESLGKSHYNQMMHIVRSPGVAAASPTPAQCAPTRPGNYEDRHPQATKNNLPWNHPIRWIMRAVCNLPDRPYDPNDPELMLIGYDELVAILEEQIGPALTSTERGLCDCGLPLKSCAECRQAFPRPDGGGT